jgi:hypothetical protein
MKRLLAKGITIAVLVAALVLPQATSAFADTSPNGPGQPGAPTQTCGLPNATQSPGSSVNAPGSVFNPSGTAGTVYAGNPGTASLAHSNSDETVSQYDIACFQVSQPHP